MPLYTYEHPETGEYIDVVQGMNDEHSYTDDKGVKWKRVYYIPEASIDSNIDPFNNRSFIDKTGNSKGNYGDLMDRSKEMSQKREDKLGYDPVKRKYFDDYSKNRRGIKHHLDRG
jgi:hypothetical protein